MTDNNAELLLADASLTYRDGAKNIRRAVRGEHFQQKGRDIAVASWRGDPRVPLRNLQIGPSLSQWATFVVEHQLVGILE